MVFTTLRRLLANNVHMNDLRMWTAVIFHSIPPQQQICIQLVPYQARCLKDFNEVTDRTDL